MTEEEMAEAYVKANVHYEIAKRENGAEYAKEVSSVTIKQAFLAGLKADKTMHVSTKWHDLQKDQSDLPPVEETGNVSIDVLTGDGRIAYYFFDESCWYDSHNNEIDSPIAWCEIPRFEK